MERIVGSDVRGVRLRGRPRTGSVDHERRALNGRGMCVEQDGIIVCDSSEWRAVVNA